MLEKKLHEELHAEELSKVSGGIRTVETDIYSVQDDDEYRAAESERKMKEARAKAETAGIYMKGASEIITSIGKAAQGVSSLLPGGQIAKAAKGAAGAAAAPAADK